MSTAKVVILTVLSCSSLIIALYCLIFMVPVKRFWQRIRRLGGGLKGIEAHLNGVRSSIGQRLEEVEKNTQEQLEESRREFQKSMDRLSRANRETRRELRELRQTVESLQADLQKTSTDSRKALRCSESLGTRLQQTQEDFKALDAELRQAVRRHVSDSFSSVESTVLATLEAIQQEILYGFSDTPSRRGNGPKPPPPGARQTRDNIITVEPLFASLNRDEANGQAPEKESEQSEDQGTDGPETGDEQQQE